MSTPKNRVPLPGSTRQPLPGARAIGPANPTDHLEVTVMLRPNPASRDLVTSLTTDSQLPGTRDLPDRAAVESAFSADPADIQQVEDFAHAHGLDVVEASPARRTVVLGGTVAAVSAAFGVQLETYEHSGGTYRGRTGDVHIPAELADIVQGVLGLDDRPQAQPHFRVYDPNAESIVAREVTVAFTPLQLAQLYHFPPGLTGQGQCIAIIELGGGYRVADLNTYFAHLGIPAPAISSVSVDHGRNQPTGSANGPDGEVMLDIEVAGAVAPKARIVVYFAPNTDRGFLDAITTAMHDTVRKPSIISISWGGPESSWTAQALQAYNQAFQEAAALGVTVCAASGDDGSADGVNDGRAHVDFPASSPFVLACGGTKLEASGPTISSEVVWNEGPGNGATGGGVSDKFALPTWQQSAHVPPSANPGHHVGRGVPDVAGDADPATGYTVRVDGHDMVIGGTSAVAPLWAGLIALLNQRLGHPVGYLNPTLYTAGVAGHAFRDITSGNNGAYPARAGWDACTGLGSPDGAKLLTALDGH